ncbi:Cullin, partial [Gorgonomyces haynaldii]
MRRKLIRPPTKQNVDDQWESLKGGLMEMYNRNSTHLSFEQLYRNAYNLVLQKRGEFLYLEFKKLLQEHLQSGLSQIHPPKATSEMDLFLRKLLDLWTQHLLDTEMSRDILMYLDRTWVKQSNKLMVYDLGLDIYLVTVVETSLWQHILGAILYLVERDRLLEQIDRTLVKNSIQVLSYLSKQDKTKYLIDFEPVYLERTLSFYQAESNEKQSRLDCQSYLLETASRLDQEKERSSVFLLSSSVELVTQQFLQAMVKEKLNDILQMPNGLVYFLDQGKYEDLKRMHYLFGLVSGGHDLLKQAIGQHIQTLYRPFQISKESPVEWVNYILSLKTHYDQILALGLSNDKPFEIAINTALQLVVNMEQRAPEYCSLFIDHHLRKKGGQDDFSDSTLIIFKFLQEKDVFERYYKQHLAKRLLSKGTANEDGEKQVISKIKIEAGSQFTFKLEGMFNDVNVSTDMTSEFKSVNKSRIELGVNVLTTTFWPNQMTISDPIVFPKDMQDLVDKFTSFYLNKHSGRRLQFTGQMGSVDVRAQFSEKKEINCSTLAACLLLEIFNDCESISFEDIQRRISIPEQDLVRTLQSLSLGKYRVITKSTKTKEILASDMFSVNTAFTTPLTKIKIATVAAQPQETDQERLETLKKIEESRKHQIEACIVRIMKARQRLDHNSLSNQVFEQMGARFQPTLQLVKSRIESLIEREYLARDEQDRSVYNYVA